MDTNQLGIIVLAFIEAHFSNGILEFYKQKGILSFVPFADDAVLIHHPDMPKEFRDAIERFNNSSGITIHIVDDINFVGMSPVEVSRIMVNIGEMIEEKYGIPTLLYNPLNPLVFVVTIPFVVLSKDAITDIAGIFSKRLPSIARGILIVGEEKYPFSSCGVYEVTKDGDIPVVHIEPERTSITSDAITDLKILLETGGDVLDIINKL